MIRKKMFGFFEVFLLIGSLVASAHFAGFVSGNEILDSLNKEEAKAATCVVAQDGSSCQQFPAGTCDALCTEPCLDGERNGVPECKVGVCVDDDEGICSAGATRNNCEEKGGRFVGGSITEIAECQQHCCILGNEAQFVTEKRCDILSREFGIEMNFDTNYNNADLCSMFGKQNAIGACTWPSEKEGLSECRLTTLSDCINSLGVEANFNEGKLCSNEDLNTVCEKQNNTGCVDGLDGVYYFDSCGNRENIFSVDEDVSWNDGEILPLEESCLIGSASNKLENQETCGNCNRLAGSVCAEEIGGQELNDNPDSGVVCKDLGCDDDGKRRENGETWCEYVGDFGPSVDVPLLGVITNYVNLPFGNALLRAKSAPGGEQYRKSCIDGEIVTEVCGPYRNGICIESQTKIEGEKKFSTASCIPNRWAGCLNYNAGGDGALGDLTNAISSISSIPGIGAVAGKALALPTEAEKVKVLKMMLNCEADPDCFVKTVSVDKDFKFPLCVPKYPPGFYKKEMDENDAGICSFASQMCSTVWVKESTAFTFGATAHWVCKAGCKCVDGNTPESATPSAKFINEMHSLCVSLGDCGMKTNYVGDLGGVIQGYSLKKAEYEGLPKAPDKNRKKVPTSGLPPLPPDDSKAAPRKYIDAGIYNKSGFEESGSGSGEGGVSGPQPPRYKPNSQSTTLFIASGVAGATALGATITAAINPGLVAFQGAAIGASIGVAVVSLLVGFSGIGAGVGTGGTIAYVASGAVAGGAIGLGIILQSGPLAHFGAITAVIIVADIIAQWIAGVGEIKTVEMYFECKPWTAPSVPKCEECGKHGVPCNQYNCETLGKECTFVAENEGVEDENVPLCVAVEFNDAAAPKIDKLIDDALNEGFSYENVQGLGSEKASFEINKVRADDGCINQYEKLNFGFELNEPGECAYSFEPEKEFDEMFSLNSGLRYNHVASLGEIWKQIDSESEEVQNLNLYIKCKDYQLDETRGGTVSGDNVMSFCVNPLDLTPPLVVNTNVPQGFAAGYAQETINVIITFDESVSEARLDIADKDFDDMQYEMSCSENVCVVEVPIALGNNQFYVKARDLEGNEMGAGHAISIPRSEKNLEIISVNSDGEALDGKKFVKGNAYSAVEVVVKTGGGVDGTADCAYNFGEFGSAFFKETGIGKTTTHKQLFERLVDGSYGMEISCVDSAGNSANQSVSFSVEADVSPPSITRVYDELGTLVVISSEKGTCAYSPDKCNFKVSEGKLFDGNELIHTTLLDRGAKYYIKCKDDYGNEPSQCSLVVKGGEL